MRARLQQRRLGRSFRRELVLADRHRPLAKARWAPAQRAVQEHEGSLSERDPRFGSRARGPWPGMRRRGLQRRRLQRPLHHRRRTEQAAVEQRQRRLYRGRMGRRNQGSRLVHGRRGRRREPRRPSRPVRRGVHRPQHSGSGLRCRLSQQRVRRSRPPLPEHRPRQARSLALPRGRRPGRPRGRAIRPQPRCGVLRFQRRWSPRPVRRQRR